MIKVMVAMLILRAMEDFLSMRGKEHQPRSASKMVGSGSLLAASLTNTMLPYNRSLQRAQVQQRCAGSDQLDSARD